MIEQADLPAPLTPADCDLRHFPYLQVDVTRMRDSDMVALLRPEECWAAFLLYLVSWHQVPAASLPGNDQVLARLCQCTMARWRKIRDAALRGWILCSDGRLYHPVVAEMALNAWAKSRKQKDRAEHRWAASKSIAHLNSAGDMPLISKDLGPATAMQGKEKEKGKEEYSVPEGTDAAPGGALHPHRSSRKAWAKAVTVLKTQGEQSEPAARKAFGKLLAAYELDAEDMLEVLNRCAASQTPDPLSYLTKAAKGLVEARANTVGPRTDEPRTLRWGERHWDLAIRRFSEEDLWSEEIGPPPTEPGCRAPLAVLAKYGYQARAERNSPEPEQSSAPCASAPERDDI